MRESLVERLASEARKLPPRLAHAARYVTLHPFEAATKPMRSLARDAGHSPATFTRLAQALGYAGWDEFRVEIVEHARVATTRAPFSRRKIAAGSLPSIAHDMITADTQALGDFNAEQLQLAAPMLENASRVMVAGFRSCHSLAHLFYYLYSLFRSDVVLLGGNGGLLDIELGGIRHDDAIVIFSFEPYSRNALMTARAAAEAGCLLIAIVDREDAPLADAANLTLTFPTLSPSFFPSLTAGIGLIQALVALLYVRSGRKGRDALRRSESRIEEHNAYAAGIEPVRPR